MFAGFVSTILSDFRVKQIPEGLLQYRWWGPTPSFCPVGLGPSQEFRFLTSSPVMLTLLMWGTLIITALIHES